MSRQPIATTQYVEVCDLCGEPVDTYGHRDWMTLNVGHPSAEPDVPEKRKIKFFRKPAGDNKSGAPKTDRRSWKWDFHGECLVKALDPLVIATARKEGHRDA